MRSLCNVDGRIQPASSVSVPLLDRGFLFGDSIYEVVRTHRGTLFGLEGHYQRLAASAERLGFALPLDEARMDVSDRVGPFVERDVGKADVEAGEVVAELRERDGRDGNTAERAGMPAVIGGRDRHEPDDNLIEIGTYAEPRPPLNPPSLMGTSAPT